MPLIQVTSGGQRSLLKKKLQVCESQQSCLFVGDQILIFHHNLQIHSLKILQCDFLFFLFLSLSVEVYLWWKLQASLIFLSGRTCTIDGWLNTFLPHCITYFHDIYPIPSATSLIKEFITGWTSQKGIYTEKYSVWVLLLQWYLLSHYQKKLYDLELGLGNNSITIIITNIILFNKTIWRVW